MIKLELHKCLIRNLKAKMKMMTEMIKMAKMQQQVEIKLAKRGNQ